MYTNEVVQAVVAYLESCRNIFDDNLAQYNLTLRGIYDHEKDTIPVDMYPCLMLGDNLHVNKRWNEAHYGIEESYSFEINGYLIYSTDQHNATAIRLFADTLSRVCERHEMEELSLGVNEWKIVWPPEQPALSDVEIGYAYIGEAFCRSFHANLTMVVDRSMLIHGETISLIQ